MDDAWELLLLLWCALLIAATVATVVAKHLRKTANKRWTVTAFDADRCERGGSQREFARRLNARTGR